MSAIWENEEVKEKILLLSPALQESFLRSVDALHCRESTFMLTFIKESRDELRDTHKEIEREQEVLRDTSDLLASKRIYGDPDEWEDNSHEMNAVDEYLNRRNNGEVGGLGILSFEDEQSKSRKKAKKKDKHRDKDRSKSSKSSRSDALSSKLESYASETLDMENELILEKADKKKAKKDKKEKREKDKVEKPQDDNATDISEAPKEKKDKKQKKEKKNNGAPKDVDKEEESKEVKEKSHKEKKKSKEKLEEISEAPDEIASEIIDDSAERKAEEKAKKREEKAERKRLEKLARQKSEQQNLEEKRNAMKPEREKSAPILFVREQSEIEKESNVLMQEFITRQSTDVDQKNKFEEAMKRKLERKKNPHAAEADKLLKQQAWADEAIDREKAAYEAKMMEKLRSRREKSGLTNREMSSLDEPGSTSEPADKHKKEKKKKKNKDKKKEDDDEGSGQEEKEKKKKKKKDKDKEEDK